MEFDRQLAFALVYFIFLLLHRAGETQPRQNSSPRLHFGFQFRLCHVVVALSVLHGISLAYFILAFAFLVDQILFRSYVHQPHYRSRSPPYLFKKP